MKILILAYDFPPLASAGAQRPFSWFKYFKEFGIHPVVITRQWDINVSATINHIKSSDKREKIIDISLAGTVISVPYTSNFRDKIILKYGETRFVFMRKVLSFLLSYFKFYIRYFDNTNDIFITANNYLLNNTCDMIIATGEPFILFRHAYSLSRKFKIPYVLDYRDGWTSGFDLDLDSRKYRVLTRFLFRKKEKKYLEGAKLITVASKTYIPKLKEILNEDKYYEILNGYFEESFINSSKLAKDNIFVILYSGKLYKFQPIEAFLDTLLVNLRKDVEIKIQFIGGDGDISLQKRLHRYINHKLLNIELLPRQNYDKYIELIIQADLLLLLSKNSGGWLNTKLFDYLPSGKRILLFESDDNVMDKILEECSAGYSCKTPLELGNTINKFFSEFSIYGQLKGVTVNYEQYTRRRQVEKLAQILAKCVE